MKDLAKLLLALLSFPALAASSAPWLKPAPASVGTWANWTELPASSFFEVPASKLSTAEHWLAKAPFLPQEQNDIAYFGRPDFKCSPPAKPYLLRAAYINGGTGSFALYWSGSALIVSHGSLGPGGAPSKSALVVCLSKAPTAVYSSLSSAL
ncbi:hypothetical protein [Lysobacter sp. CFH 32150]|uniref:hypothetical protein n=1 Tax=Lysobacter sp. CFH 32150 TaxID=2927128 RepID=UPI001FA7A33A|nr:hypothetical protein [Lysobacter sp. CFH 32150]MCI4569477.1 hypothetical protein [Lysobacter sp. CFH 32150]